MHQMLWPFWRKPPTQRATRWAVSFSPPPHTRGANEGQGVSRSARRTRQATGQLIRHCRRTSFDAAAHPPLPPLPLQRIDEHLVVRQRGYSSPGVCRRGCRRGTAAHTRRGGPSRRRSGTQTGCNLISREVIAGEWSCSTAHSLRCPCRASACRRCRRRQPHPCHGHSWRCHAAAVAAMPPLQRPFAGPYQANPTGG